MQRLSMWALPAAGDAEVFAACIERLAAATGTSPFAPHVTVVGSLDPSCADAAGPAVAPTREFTVELLALEDSDERFRAITLRAAAPPPLIDLRARVIAACRVDAPPYEPHLSLLYGELPPHRRQELRDAVTIALPRRVTVDCVSLVDTSADDSSRWATVRTWKIGQ